MSRPNLNDKITEEMTKFLMKFCPKHNIWWCDDDGTRWNILNNGDAEDDLVAFITRISQATAREIINELESNPTPGSEFINLQLWIEAKQSQLRTKFNLAEREVSKDN